MNIKRYIGSCLKLINEYVPKGHIISFYSTPDFADNAFALFDTICHENLGIDYFFVWHISDKNKIGMIKAYVKHCYPNYNNIKVVYRKSAKSIYYFICSYLIVATHGLWEGLRIPDKQTSLLLWHGMPLKRIGYMNEKDCELGIVTGDIYSVSSPFFAEQFEKCFHAKKDQILILGQPRTDYLFLTNKKWITNALGITAEKVFIFMPTYRKSKVGPARQDGEYANQTLFSLSLDEWKRLDHLLEVIGGCMIVKPHPLEDVKNIDFIKGRSRIIKIDDNLLTELNVQLYQLLSITDALITDFSSVYIDYLLLDRPICFYIPDLEKYEKDRGFVVDNIYEYLPGNVCRNYDQIEQFLKCTEDPYRAERVKLNNKWNTFCLGESSKSILTYLSSKNLLSIRRKK